MSGFRRRLALVLHTARRHRALVIGDSAGADTVVCACVTAPTAATAGRRIIQLWVDILRAPRKRGSSVRQGERHTAMLDQESPPKPSLQIGVLKWGETELLQVCHCVIF